jgi:hypothetical protein
MVNPTKVLVKSNGKRYPLVPSFPMENVNQINVWVKIPMEKILVGTNFSDGKCPTSQGFRNHPMENYPLIGHFPAHILFTNGCYFSIGFLPNG